MALYCLTRSSVITGGSDAPLAHVAKPKPCCAWFGPRRQAVGSARAAGPRNLFLEHFPTHAAIRACSSVEKGRARDAGNIRARITQQGLGLRYATYCRWDFV